MAKIGDVTDMTQSFISPKIIYMYRKHEVTGSEGGFTARWHFRAVNGSIYCTEL